MVLSFGFVRTVFLYVFLAFVCTSQFVFAQSGEGVTVIPATIEESANPGSVLIRSLKVTNESEKDSEYYLTKKNIKGVETGGVPIFAEEAAEPTSFEISEWITFESEKIFVPANSSVDVPVTITVPSDATPGSHFGGVFVSVEAPKIREIGAGVGYEVASIISIRISGDVIDTARIRSFSAENLIYGSKDVHFVAKIENQGNILIRPRGPLTITSMSGKKTVITVNDSLAGVFPGTVRDIAFDWSEPGLGFGKYEAVLALSYDGNDGQKTIDMTTVFWVFPVKVMLSVIGGFVLIFVLGYVFTQHYIKKAIMRTAGGRRVVPMRYRKRAGVSRFAFMFISLLSVLVIFLIVMLIFFA